jgi:cobalt-zinc-cadmium resistance protein CzcA
MGDPSVVVGGGGFIGGAIARRGLVFLICAMVLAIGGYEFHTLPIEAYPNIAPLNVQVITQWSGRSTLEIERQLTVPVETAMAGMPDVSSVRSASLFGLSVVTIQFRDGTDSFRARHNVQLYLDQVNFPTGVQPQLSPDADALGEVMRYRLDAGPGNGPGGAIDLIDLKSLQDWVVTKSLLSVPGVAAVNGFGGTVKQYQVLPDPQKLLQYGVTLAQLSTALTNGNANVGGGLLPSGQQQVVVRGVGLVQTLDDLRNTVVAVNHGVPVRVSDVATVQIGHADRLGQVQFDQSDDIVQGILVMRRGSNASEVLVRLRERIASLNSSGQLPDGVKVVPFYDRQNLLDLTVHTVAHTLLVGIVLVIVVLYVFLGNFRVAMIVSMTIPLGLAVAFAGMNLLGVPANLISLGAIDFGLIVNAAVIVTENIMQYLERADSEPSAVFRSATAEVTRGMIFSTAIIIVAYAPLLLLGGVEGKIFAPMALTMGFALLASIALSTSFIPAAMAALFGKGLAVHSPKFIDWLQGRYRRLLEILVVRPYSLGLVSLAVLVLSGLVLARLGTSFLPTLDENNLWIRVTLPNTVDLAYSGPFAAKVRRYMAAQPEVAHVAAQIGRPDDGTDSTGVFNAEFAVYFKPLDQWPAGVGRQDVVDRLQKYFDGIPGIDVNFSQYIQDNVDEALSGVKGENSVKLFGDDLDVLDARAHDVEKIIGQIPGIVDVGIFKELGQPTLNLSVDRAAAARYGLNVSDIESLVLGAIGGNPVSQVQEGEKLFDLVVRLPQADRATLDQIRRLLVDTPDGNRVPIARVADIKLTDGPFFIYRESARRYIAVKFGVRGRDLGGAVAEAREKVAQSVALPRGYLVQWDGQFNEMKVAQQKLLTIIPMVLFGIFVLLVIAFGRAMDAALVLINVPFAAIGGIAALWLAHEDLSISAGIGFLSLFGIAIQNLVILITSIRSLYSSGSFSLNDAVIEGSVQRFRSVVMTALLAALGLMPAAFSHAIGSQAQRPLALVVFGGMLSTSLLTLLLLPVAFARVASFRMPSKEPIA